MSIKNTRTTKIKFRPIILISLKPVKYRTFGDEKYSRGTVVGTTVARLFISLTSTVCNLCRCLILSTIKAKATEGLEGGRK
jgi:hypothetical protein